jgi:putative heme-binding domain-containing protein
VTWEVRNRESIERLLSVAAAVVSDSHAASEARAEALRLLALDDFQRLRTIPSDLFSPTEPQEVQSAAVAAIASFSEPAAGPLLLSHWRNATPTIRSEIVLAMLNGRNRMLPLLQSIDAGLIPPNQVPFARRATLLRSGDTQVKELARKIFGNAAPAARKDVIAKYQTALSRPGNPEAGKKVFETNCATCHRAGEIGKDVGPNLATIRQWNPDQILINILDPNREVASNFLAYTVEARDGRTVDGIIAEESAASLTLKRADGASETVLRRDVLQISGSGLSLMPEGLENSVTVEQMADLIAFLKASP